MHYIGLGGFPGRDQPTCPVGEMGSHEIALANIGLVLTPLMIIFVITLFCEFSQTIDLHVYSLVPWHACF